MIQPLHLTPADLKTMTEILRSNPDVLVDWLQDGVGRNFRGAGLEEQKLDVLLCYARDDWMPFANGAPLVLDEILPEAILGRWLTAVGDRRGQCVARSMVYESVKNNICGWRSLLPLDDLPMNSDLHRSGPAARLDLKRRVLGIFADLERPLTATEARNLGIFDDSLRLNPTATNVCFRLDDLSSIKSSPAKSVLNPLGHYFLNPIHFLPTEMPAVRQTPSRAPAGPGGGERG